MYNINHWHDAERTRIVLAALLVEAPALAALVRLDHGGLAIRSGEVVEEFDRVREVWREFARRLVHVLIK